MVQTEEAIQNLGLSEHHLEIEKVLSLGSEPVNRESLYISIVQTLSK